MEKINLWQWQLIAYHDIPSPASLTRPWMMFSFFRKRSLIEHFLKMLNVPANQEGWWMQQGQLCNLMVWPWRHPNNWIVGNASHGCQHQKSEQWHDIPQSHHYWDLDERRISHQAMQELWKRTYFYKILNVCRAKTAKRVGHCIKNSCDKPFLKIIKWFDSTPKIISQIDAAVIRDWTHFSSFIWRYIHMGNIFKTSIFL